MLSASSCSPKKTGPRSRSFSASQSSSVCVRRTSGMSGFSRRAASTVRRTLPAVGVATTTHSADAIPASVSTDSWDPSPAMAANPSRRRSSTRSRVISTTTHGRPASVSRAKIRRPTRP